MHFNVKSYFKLVLNLFMMLLVPVNAHASYRWQHVPVVVATAAMTVVLLRQVGLV